ncbi:hypothetical protein SM033_00227 [Vibrio phage vB_VpaM_sm033]|nr:hypothetical protein SM033_00227 [Vibrio phage vB_VpaM_sm033]
MGYVDYNDPDYYNPIKSVTHHPSMESERILKHQIKKLIRLGVPEKAQMGIRDILDLPIDLYDMVMEAVIENNQEEAERAEELQNQMDEAVKKLKENKDKAGNFTEPPKEKE